MSDDLSHLGDGGAPKMIDVADKPETARLARAEAFVRVAPSTLVAIRTQAGPKGDVLAVARLAALQAPKRTAELVPLCHPLRIGGVDVDVDLVEPDRVRIHATVRAMERTGVEMEALTAVLVGALTIYDMTKAIDRGATIEAARVLEKRGGKSGAYLRES